MCQRQGKRERQGESWALCCASWLPTLAKGMMLQREWRILIDVFCFICWGFFCTALSMPRTHFANFVKVKTLSKNTHLKLNESKDGILPYIKKKKKDIQLGLYFFKKLSPFNLVLWWIKLNDFGEITRIRYQCKKKQRMTKTRPSQLTCFCHCMRHEQMLTLVHDFSPKCCQPCVIKVFPHI